MTASSETSGEVTRLLAESAAGNTGAFDRLMPLVYDDLVKIARRRLQAEQVGHTLDTTALVHESYMRLVDHRGAEWTDRSHFLAVASRVARNVLVDHARRRKARKRGGGKNPITLEHCGTGGEGEVVDLLALDEALTRLADFDPRLEMVVVYRFFGGMTMEETASALGASLRTVERDWQRARGYLFEALRDTDRSVLGSGALDDDSELK